MEIVDKQWKLIRADEFPVGDAFLVDGAVFIKTDRTDSGGPKCVKLDSGKLITVDADVMVMPVNAKIVIE